MFEIVLAVVISTVLATVAASAGVAYHAHDKHQRYDSSIDLESQDITPYDGFVHHLCKYMRMHDQRYSLERPKVIEDFKKEMKNWNGEYKPVAKAFSKMGDVGAIETIFHKYGDGHHAGEIVEMVGGYTDKEITRLILEEAWQHGRMPKVNKNWWKTIMRG